MTVSSRALVRTVPLGAALLHGRLVVEVRGNPTAPRATNPTVPRGQPALPIVVLLRTPSKASLAVTHRFRHTRGNGANRNPL